MQRKSLSRRGVTNCLYTVKVAMPARHPPTGRHNGCTEGASGGANVLRKEALKSAFLETDRSFFRRCGVTTPQRTVDAFQKASRFPALSDGP
jgi:hypothetical protein